MAQEITLSIYERNAKLFNKKGLRRQFSSIPLRWTEYIPSRLLGASNKVVLKATIDKDYYEGLVEILKGYNFDILGDTNDFHIKNLYSDYKENEDKLTKQKEQMEAISKDLDSMEENRKPYKEIENEDVEFFFCPYNEGITCLYEFIAVCKDKILEYAKANDITIMLKVIGCTAQCEGFFGFNFYDADSKEEDVVVDYASSLNVGVDFKDRVNMFVSALLLSAIGESEDELVAMNTHIFAENCKYTN